MGLVSPNERDRWDETEATKVAWQWITTELLGLCDALVQYNAVCESPFWLEFDKRDDAEWNAICRFLNQLFNFQYESGRLLGGHWWVLPVELESMIAPCLDWARNESQSFLTASLQSRIRDALGLSDSIDLGDLIIEEGDLRTGVFQVRKLPDNRKHFADGIDIELSSNCRLDAFPEAHQTDFRPIDESLVLSTLQRVLTEALKVNAGYTPTLEGVRDGHPRDVESASPSAEPLVLDARQKRILEVLAGKALRAQAIADACGFEKNKLYQKRADGSQPLSELVDHRLVIKDRKVGFYRPDAPPPNVVQPGTQPGTPKH